MKSPQAVPPAPRALKSGDLLTLLLGFMVLRVLETGYLTMPAVGESSYCKAAVQGQVFIGFSWFALLTFVVLAVWGTGLRAWVQVEGDFWARPYF